MSGLPFELLLALRYLRPRRTFVSVITVISVIGVALGVAVLLIVISVMTGYDQQLRDTIFGFNAHLHVYQAGASMTNYAAVAGKVAANPNVIGVAPSVMGPVLAKLQVSSGQSPMRAPIVRGIEPEAERTVSTLASNLVAGEFDLNGRGIIVGTAFADDLNLRIGDRLSIYGPRDLKRMEAARTKEEQEMILPDEYEVRGIFDTGHYEFNSQFVLISLPDSQDLYDIGDSVHTLTVMLKDPFRAAEVKRELETALGPNYAVATWLQQSSLLSAVIVEKNMLLYILFFIVIVAAFGITCTLITFIVMKTREIGLLKALGATDRQVMWVFMGQSMIVSLFGIVTGITGGLLLVRYRNEFLMFMRKVTGTQLFPADIYGFSRLPALVLPSDIAIICGGSLLICLLAAALPARYASRMSPVEALRYE